MKKRFVSLLLAALLLLSVQTAARAEYIYGYFRYEVTDRSVTITAYTGHETTVTVPAMIGGNPVNAVAPGAFAGSGAVTVYLPDTITYVSDGAFDGGQSVVYGGGKAPAPTPAAPEGIRDENGNLITTDDAGNLIRVDPQGNETVLDDSQNYSRETGVGGGTVIRGGNGSTVAVQNGGTVSLTAADGSTAPLAAAAPAGISAEEAEAEEPAPAPTEAPEPQPQAPSRALPLLGLTALFLILCTIRMKTRPKRKKRR